MSMPLWYSVVQYVFSFQLLCYSYGPQGKTWIYIYITSNFECINCKSLQASTTHPPKVNLKLEKLCRPKYHTINRSNQGRVLASTVQLTKCIT